MMILYQIFKKKSAKRARYRWNKFSQDILPTFWEPSFEPGYSFANSKATRAFLIFPLSMSNILASRMLMGRPYWKKVGERLFVLMAGIKSLWMKCLIDNAFTITKVDEPTACA